MPVGLCLAPLWGGEFRVVSTGESALRRSASWVAAGALLSAPIAMVVVALVQPQPPWTDAARFVGAYHPIQALPYLLGFLLLWGFVRFSVACHLAAGPTTATTTALVFTTIYAALVFANYTLQVGYVPRVLVEAPEQAAALTMANPGAFAWFLEMYGYAAEGVATWLLADLFGGSRRGRVIRALLQVNGVMSLVGAACTGAYDRWVFSSAGMISFAAWNVVVVVCFGLIAFTPDGGLSPASRSRPLQSAS